MWLVDGSEEAALCYLIGNWMLKAKQGQSEHSLPRTQHMLKKKKKTSWVKREAL